MRLRTFAPATLAPATLVAAIVAALVLAVAAPGSAGGWWSYIDLEHEDLVVGETVTAQAQVMFRTTTEAEAADGYHAYLVRGIDHAALDAALTRPDPTGWWSPPREIVHLGAVEVDDRDANLARAVATFEVPAVPPGIYGLMFCTAGCEEPMADVIPTLDLALHTDAASAATSRAIRSLDGRVTDELALLDEQLGRLAEDVRTARRLLAGEVGDLETVTAELATAVGAVRDDVRDLAAAAPAGGEQAPFLWFLAGAVLAGGAALGAGRRRSDRVAGIPGGRTTAAPGADAGRESPASPAVLGTSVFGPDDDPGQLATLVVSPRTLERDGDPLAAPVEADPR
jgi:hypothetical protein